MTETSEKKFASRAGYKLEHAFEAFSLNVAGKVCADLGASTGGFTDCLLQHGATKVYAVETGYGVLDWKLRNDERVVVLERKNALHVELPEPVDFISVDVSWTPQRLIIPAAAKLLKPDGLIVSLLKPHYEAERSQLVKGTVPEEFLEIIVDKVRQQLENIGIQVVDTTRSPITGGKGGNTEFLLLLKPRVA